MKAFFLLLAFVLSFGACKPKELKQLQQSSSALIEVLAEETAQLAGTKKTVVLITTERAKPADEETEIKTTLKKHGLTIVNVKSVQLGDPMQFDQFGLKASDLAEIIEKNPDVGAIVSLVGAPLIKAGELSGIRAEHPPVIVVATGMIGYLQGVPTKLDQVARLVDAKIIQLAIMDGADPNAPKTASSDARKVFDQNYRILRPAQK